MGGTGNKGHVLFITYDGMTDPLGQSQCIPYAAELTKLGYTFTMIGFEKPDRYEKYKGEIAALMESHNLEWASLPYTKWPPGLSTLWDMWRLRKHVLALHKKKPYDMLHCRSYLPGLMGLMMKAKFDVPFLFDMRGFYADERVDGGLWKLSNPIYKAAYDFFKRKEKQLLSQASYVISLTHKAKDIIHTWGGITGQPVGIDVIPCCADLDLFSPESINPTLKSELTAKLGLQNAGFVLSYLGSIGSWYMLDEMLAFFKCLLDKRPNARFLFITTEPPSGIIDKAKQQGIPSESIIVSPAARMDVPTYLALSDWSIFFIKPAFSKQASSPTKQAEIMGMGMPHVCNAGVGDVDDVIESDKIGLLVDIPADKNYAPAIDKMLTTTTDRIEIRKIAEHEFSLVEGVKRFYRAYDIVLQPKS